MELSLEEKAGQLIMTYFHGETANEEAKTLIQDTKIGGIIYYTWSNGLTSPKQVKTLSEKLQEFALTNPNPIPLLIATDQETGIVNRLKEGFTLFPGNRAVGEIKDAKIAETIGLYVGRELKNVGINMNLAPVVDVNNNPKNPVIGVRSFGEDPELVSLLGQGALNGYKKANVIATLKHFPGHGDTTTDSHENLPIVHKSQEELEKVELSPFKALAPSAQAIMTAHILTAFDSQHCATISKSTLDYLRETIGFQGVIVSDSLVMEGLLKQCQTIDEAAIRSLNAGCDLLLLGGRLLSGERKNELSVADIQRVHRSIIAAVESGRISEERINQAVERVLNLKTQIDCHENDFSLKDHQNFAQKVASLALKTIKNDKKLIASLHEKSIAIVAPHILQQDIQKTHFLEAGKQVDLHGFNPTNVDLEKIKQDTQNADVIFIFSYNAWKTPSQAALIQSLIDTNKPVALFVVKDPIDASLFPNANLILNTFDPTFFSIQAIYNFLYQLKGPEKKTDSSSCFSITKNSL